MAIMRGIDISVHNGNVDLQKAKQNGGIEFAIIRAGYGKTPNTDKNFETNYDKAVKAMMHVGAYWYSYATTEQEAVQEADAFIETIKGKRFDMPVYYDLEEPCTKQNASNLARAFCKRLEEKGYFVGIYASKAYIEAYFDNDVRTNYSMWVAQWASMCTYADQFGMWQLSDSGEVPGISGNVDLDVSYFDYPTIIINKGFNGYSKQTEQQPETTPVKHLVQVFIDGEEVFCYEY